MNSGCYNSIAIHFIQNFDEIFRGIFRASKTALKFNFSNTLPDLIYDLHY